MRSIVMLLLFVISALFISAGFADWAVIKMMLLPALVIGSVVIILFVIRELRNGLFNH